MEALGAQYLYVTLVLPSFFGVTLIGEGVYKILHSQLSGLFNLMVGIIFMVVVVVAYLWAGELV